MPEKLLVLKDFLSLEKEEAVNYDFKREVFKKRGLEYNNENMINNILLYKSNERQSRLRDFHHEKREDRAIDRRRADRVCNNLINKQ